ncbi:MAG: class I SAM-dependent methyltransferase [candidate division Zixibacteria bacterium]
MDEILSYYDSYDESSRLAGGYTSLEYTRTIELLERYLPPPPAVVLDIGGASGMYACPLARMGYEVHLIDPVEKHLKQAKEESDKQPDHPIAGISSGDARALESPDSSVDVVLLMGPLYHLTEPDDRLKALREAYRVLRDGGVLFATYISRYASVLDGLVFGFVHDPEFFEIVKQDLKDGQHRNTTDNNDYFTTAYFHHPDEIKPETEEAGFKLDKILAIEGPGWLIREYDSDMKKPDRRDRILEIVRMLEEDRSLLPLSDHIAAVGRK